MRKAETGEEKEKVHRNGKSLAKKKKTEIKIGVKCDGGGNEKYGRN